MVELEGTMDPVSKAIVEILDEMFHGGSRICSPEERAAAAEEACAKLETLKALAGLPAGRGDTR